MTEQMASDLLWKELREHEIQTVLSRFREVTKKAKQVLAKPDGQIEPYDVLALIGVFAGLSHEAGIPKEEATSAAKTFIDLAYKVLDGNPHTNS